jgi:predicted DNA-binding transcriptional regulator YafY
MKIKDDLELTLYTINDLAELFKVTPRTIYNYVYTEQLNGYKIAKKWRF